MYYILKILWLNSRRGCLLTGGVNLVFILTGINLWKLQKEAADAARRQDKVRRKTHKPPSTITPPPPPGGWNMSRERRPADRFYWCERGKTPKKRIIMAVPDTSGLGLIASRRRPPERNEAEALARGGGGGWRFN